MLCLFVPVLSEKGMEVSSAMTCVGVFAKHHSVYWEYTWLSTAVLLYLAACPASKGIHLAFGSEWLTPGAHSLGADCVEVQRLQSQRYAHASAEDSGEHT